MSNLEQTAIETRNNAETAFLSSLVVYPDNVPIVKDIIDHTGFMCPTRALIYKSMCDMHIKGLNVEINLITPSVPAVHQKEVRTTLQQLSLTGQYSTDVVRIARYLKEQQTRKQYVEMSADAHSKAMEGEKDIFELIANNIADSQNLINGIIRGNNTVSVGEAVKSAICTVKKTAEIHNKGGRSGISTGLRGLDYLLGGGWGKGQLVTLAGQTGRGKTSVGLHFAKTSAMCGTPTLYFTLEMNSEELGLRLVNSSTDINPYDIKLGMLDDRQIMEVESTSDVYADMKLSINDLSDINMTTIRHIVEQKNRKGDCELVVIDYVGLVNPDKIFGREQQIASITRLAKKMAKDLQITVIMLAQVNRDIEKRSGKKNSSGNIVPPSPILGDLRESSSLAHDADIVMFVDLPRKYDCPLFEGCSTTNMGVLYVAKQRNGMERFVMFGHNDSMTKITDFGSSELPF